MNKKYAGSVYILTNPSFPDYVKIGYADDVNKRVKKLNSSEAVPFSFRIYATFDVEDRLTDKKFHHFLDILNPDLRSKETIGNRTRIREFYHIKPEEIYSSLEIVADIFGGKERLHLWKPTEEEIDEEETAEILSKNRHHFKKIEFYAPITDVTYYSDTKEDGTLGVFEKNTNLEVPNNSNPSKRQILLSALENLNGNTSEGNTLYQLQHKLEKICLNK